MAAESKEDWIIVTKKSKKAKKSIANKKMDQKYIITKVYEYISTHTSAPMYCCIYGSVARNSHRVDSDVDILLLYKGSKSNKSNPKTANAYISIMEHELESILGCSVDIRSYYVKDDVMYVPESSQQFIENIMSDSLPVYQHPTINKFANYFKSCIIERY